MFEKLVPRIVLSGTLSLSLGAVGYEADNFINQAINPSEAQQLSDIYGCASHLGNMAVTTETPPTACYNVSPEYVPYYYDQQGNAHYMLPTAEEMRSHASDVRRGIDKNGVNLEGLNWLTGSLIILSTFPLFMHMTNSSKPRPKLRLIRGSLA